MPELEADQVVAELQQQGLCAGAIGTVIEKSEVEIIVR